MWEGRATSPHCAPRAPRRTPVRAHRRAAALVICAGALAHCAGDRAHSPTCGLAQVVGPTLIQQQLLNLAAVLTEAPRGLPATLPARVVGQSDQGEVLVGRTGSGSGLLMGYQGSGFPAPPGGYGLLVVDDSSARVQGVLLYESEVPRNEPPLGTVTGADHSVPLFGVRVAWASVNNARCPLLGVPAGAAPTSR